MRTPRFLSPNVARCSDRCRVLGRASVRNIEDSIAPRLVCTESSDHICVERNSAPTELGLEGGGGEEGRGQGRQPSTGAPSCGRRSDAVVSGERASAAGRSASVSVPAACLVVVMVALRTAKGHFRSCLSLDSARQAAPDLARYGKWVRWEGCGRKTRGCIKDLSLVWCLHGRRLAGLDRAKLGPRSDNARLGPGASRLVAGVRIAVQSLDNRRSRDVLRFCGGRRWLCFAADHLLSMGAPALFSAAPHLRDARSPPLAPASPGPAHATRSGRRCAGNKTSELRNVLLLFHSAVRAVETRLAMRVMQICAVLRHRSNARCRIFPTLSASASFGSTDGAHDVPLEPQRGTCGGWWLVAQGICTQHAVRGQVTDRGVGGNPGLAAALRLAACIADFSALISRCCWPASRVSHSDPRFY
jgi:hypothetical protein